MSTEDKKEKKKEQKVIVLNQSRKRIIVKNPYRRAFDPRDYMNHCTGC